MLKRVAEKKKMLIMCYALWVECYILERIFADWESF